MPNLVILNEGPDTAGCGIALKRAFDRYTDWQTRAVCRAVVYLEYPTDILWPYGESGPIQREVIELVAGADVIHVMDSEGALSPFAGMLNGKTVVVHHLGSHFRRNPRRVFMRARRFGAIQITDSLDLVQHGLRFLPIPADIDDLATLRDDSPHRRIHIAHAPTNREVKDTDKVIAAVQELGTRYPITFDLIEGVSNRECLERKARADIFVDQLRLGFGLNAIECWAMGVPVVSGLVDPKARQEALSMWGQLPWADATEQTLVSVIEHLIVDRQWQQALADRGRAHVRKWHSQESVVNQTLQVYGRERSPIIHPIDDLYPQAIA